MYGWLGDDSFWGGNGDDTIHGASFDTAYYNRPRDAYDLEIIGGDPVEVIDLVGYGGHDTLDGIERLVFTDLVIDL